MNNYIRNNQFNFKKTYKLYLNFSLVWLLIMIQLIFFGQNNKIY